MKINKKLAQLLKLLYHSQSDNIPFPTEKLLGDWSDAQPGQHVIATFVNPYRVEYGILMMLPGIENILGGIVHVPNSVERPGQQVWYVLKYLAIMSEQIELEPLL